MPPPIIALANLRKRFGSTVALDGIDLTIARPCIFGVVGPDGAGKTTLLRILVGLLEFDATTATVLGYNIASQARTIKAHLGYVPQAFSLYPDLSVQHNLEFFAEVHGLPRAVFLQRAEELLAIAQLDKFTTFLAASLSGGMKQKLALICALLHQPQVLILDEPTSGLDPQSRLALWEILGQIHREGQTIVLTTHFMEEADKLCQRVAIMDHGRILALDTPAGLKRTVGGDAIVRVQAGEQPERLGAHLRDLEGVTGTAVLGGTVQLTVRGSAGVLPRVIQAAEAGGFPVHDVSLDEPTLETVFINLTGKDLRE